jgi:hypothetical protein
MYKSTQCRQGEGATTIVNGNPSEPTRDGKSYSLSLFLLIPSASYLLRAGTTDTTIINFTSQPVTLPSMRPLSWIGVACSALHTSWVVLGCCLVVKSQDCKKKKKKKKKKKAESSTAWHLGDLSGSSVKPSCYEQLGMQFHWLSTEAVGVFSEQGGSHTDAPGP